MSSPIAIPGLPLRVSTFAQRDATSGKLKATCCIRASSRLQIMVPELMRTENPAGVATYGNFRRCSVQTETAVAPDIDGR